MTIGNSKSPLIEEHRERRFTRGFDEWSLTKNFQKAERNLLQNGNDDITAQLQSDRQASKTTASGNADSFADIPDDDGQARSSSNAQAEFVDLSLPFKCDQCPRSFYRAKDLQWHRYKHASGLVFTCDDCEGMFPTNEDFEKHLSVGCEKTRDVNQLEKVIPPNIPLDMQRYDTSVSNHERDECVSLEPLDIVSGGGDFTDFELGSSNHIKPRKPLSFEKLSAGSNDAISSTPSRVTTEDAVTNEPGPSVASGPALANTPWPKRHDLTKETFEEMNSRHHREYDELQRRITQKKYLATDKTRDDVDRQCDELERRLKKRQYMEKPFLIEPDARNRRVSKQLKAVDSKDHAVTISNIDSELQWMETEKALLQTLEAQERELGPDNISTIDTVKNTARVYLDQGKLVEAEDMYLRALHGYQNVSGPTQVLINGVINNLGDIYYCQGNLRKAEEMYVQALANFERYLGSNHPTTRNTANRLGHVYQEQGKLQEAQRLFEQSAAPAAESARDLVKDDHLRLDSKPKDTLTGTRKFTSNHIRDLGKVFRNNDTSQSSNSKNQSDIVRWATSEDACLLWTISRIGLEDWTAISKAVGTKTSEQCHYRYLRFEKSFGIDPTSSDKSSQIKFFMSAVEKGSWSKLSHWLRNHKDFSTDADDVVLESDKDGVKLEEGNLQTPPIFESMSSTTDNPITDDGIIHWKDNMENNPLGVDLESSQGDNRRRSSQMSAELGHDGYGYTDPMHEKTALVIAELKAKRREEIERRCMELDPSLTKDLLASLLSYRKSIQDTHPLTDLDWELLKQNLLAERADAKLQASDLSDLSMVEKLDDVSEDEAVPTEQNNGSDGQGSFVRATPLQYMRVPNSQAPPTPNYAVQKRNRNADTSSILSRAAAAWGTQRKGESNLKDDEARASKKLEVSNHVTASKDEQASDPQIEPDMAISVQWNQDDQTELRGKAVALFDFKAENDNELAMVEGQVLEILYRDEQGWLVAEDCKTKKTGLVPESYISMLDKLVEGVESQDIEEKLTESAIDLAKTILEKSRWFDRMEGDELERAITTLGNEVRNKLHGQGWRRTTLEMHHEVHMKALRDLVVCHRKKNGLVSLKPIVLPCEFVVIGCRVSFHPDEFENWNAHTLSHFNDLPPPSKCICLFCDDVVFEDEDHYDLHNNWRERMSHILGHFTNGETNIRPDLLVIGYVWQNNLMSDTDYNLAKQYIEAHYVWQNNLMSDTDYNLAKQYIEAPSVGADYQPRPSTNDADIPDDQSDVSFDFSATESVVSVADSIFSAISLATGSSMPSLSVSQTATDRLVRLLLEDTVIKPLCEDALRENGMSRERFKRNLSRLLKSFAIELRKEAQTREERQAAHLVRFRARNSAHMICSTLQTEKEHKNAGTGFAAVVYFNTEIEDVEGEIDVDEDSDSASESSEDTPNDFQHLENFVRDSKAFELFREGLRVFIHPPKIQPTIVSTSTLNSRRNSLSLKQNVMVTPLPEMLEDSKEEHVVASKHVEESTTTNIALSEFPEISASLKLEIMRKVYQPVSQKLALLADSLPMLSMWKRPPIAPGKTRIEWNCKCGHKIYDDFTELRPGASNRLKQALTSHNSGSTGSSRSSTLASCRGSISSSISSILTFWSSNSSRKSLESGLPTHEPPKNQLDPNNPKVVEPTPPPIEPLYLLLCYPSGRYATRLLQLDLHDLEPKSDQSLFTILRSNYKSMRGRFLSIVSLKTLKSIKFVHFEMYRSSLIDVRQKDVIPPPDHIEYRYSPAPPEVIPPIGDNHLMHLFLHPNHADEDTICLDRFPKKLKEKLCCKKGQPTNFGWGLEFVEGWDMKSIWIIAFFIFGLGSLLVGVLWAVYKHSIQDAFAIAGYMVSFAAISVGAIQSLLVM